MLIQAFEFNQDFIRNFTYITCSNLQIVRITNIQEFELGNSFLIGLN